MHSRSATALLVALLSLAAAASVAAQTPPQQLPLVQAGNFAYQGKFTLPDKDSAGVQTTWGANALGIGGDGTSLYYGCVYGAAVVRVRIPTMGGVATQIDPCRGVPNLNAINPNDPNAKLLGGVLAWNGRVILSGYAYYDGGGTATTSHFVGAAIDTASGPYKVGTEQPGLVAGYMGVIPAEWRTLLGGPALTGQCCIAIISRSSYGPSVSVFNPDHLGTQSSVPATMLVGYPQAHQTIGTYEGSGAGGYNGSTKMGGVAFPAGTRSVLFVGRQGGAFCYGAGTTNQALHMTPNPAGDLWCYDPTSSDKGAHGYPYRHQVWAYDANDLLAVKRGAKQPWDVRPYATWTLTDMDNAGSATIRGATYDAATRRLYVTGDTAGATPTVHVYEITNAVLQPTAPTEVCGDGIDNDGDGLIDEGCAPTPVAEVCGDGIDNDLDGLVDEGCTPIVVEVCGDGLDNDGDGLIDENCAERTVEVCGDLIDNDGDGLIDENCVQVKVEICGDNIDNDNDGLIDEGCVTPAALPGAPVGVYGAVKQSTVSLRWSPPLTGGIATSYLVEAGVAPGQTVYSTPVGLLTTVSVPNVGIGKYYVRVRAKNANGTSAASKEVVVSVGCSTRPRRVSGLSATSLSGLVNLTWSDADGCSGSSYSVAVGTTVGASDVQTLTADTTTSSSRLPKGSYFARVTVLSDAGQSETTDLRFDVGGDTCVTPRFRTKLKSVVTGRRVSLGWTPLDPDTAKADDQLAPVSYLIEAGSASGAANFGKASMARSGSFLNDVPPGVYFVRVRPMNGCGVGRASNEVKVQVQ